MASTLKIKANRLNIDTHSPRRGSYGRNSGIFKPRPDCVHLARSRLRRRANQLERGNQP